MNVSDFKERELAIKEKEVDLKQQEIQSKILINKRNLWLSSPLTLAIFGLLSAAIGAILQGYFDFKLEAERINQTVLIERQKFEFSLIEKSLETPEKDEAAKQLNFLLDTGLITTLNVNIALRT